jgi:probable HAF family extracellular repeat protein
MADITGPVLPDPTLVPLHQWYVSTAGSSTNAGTIGSPWSLSYAAGGADGRIVPGDTVWVRGDTYSSQTGFTITVSGTATNKVTFKQYPGETVILDGSIAEFTTLDNTAWELYGTRSSGHNVYRSVNTFPVTEFLYYGGFIQIDDEWYSLAPHKSDAYIVSDTHVWDYPNHRYLGPGIAQNTTVGSPDYGHLFIRLDNSTAQAQLGRSVTQIRDPDPRHHELYVCSSRYFGFTITGSHLVLEDFVQINHFSGCFYMGTAGQTDITMRNCGGRPMFFGARCGSVDGLTLDSCNFYAHMPSDTWWVAWQDVVGGELPADHVRKLGLDLGIATHVEVVDCVFEEFFDGILGSAPHDVEVHHTTFNYIWDDAWQMNGNLYHINFHHNFCYGAGPSLDASFTAQANPDPGTVYIHHNVIDTTTRLVFWGRYGRDDAGVRESIPLSTHGSPTEYTWPRKFYYNTIVTGKTVGAAVYVGWGLFGLTATNSQATHEVYNNIFHVMDGRAGGRDFDATSGREIYDGNVYWHYQVGSPSNYRSPWRLLHMSTGINEGTFTTVRQLRESQAFLDSQAYYARGWEFFGLSEDPQLDRTYTPHTASCQRGAVDLTTKGWPGTASYEAWRGAIDPSDVLIVTDLGTLGGSDSFAAGVNEFRQVVGVRLTPDAPQRAFLYSDGTMIDLGTLGGGESYAAGVNELGQVVGESATLSNATHAFLHSGGNMTDLGTLGGSDNHLPPAERVV